MIIDINIHIPHSNLIYMYIYNNVIKWPEGWERDPQSIEARKENGRKKREFYSEKWEGEGQWSRVSGE